MSYLDSRSNQVVLGVQSAWNTAASSFNKSIAFVQAWSVKLDRGSAFKVRGVGRKSGQVVLQTVGIPKVAGSMTAYMTPDDPTTQELLAAIMTTNAVSGSTFYTHTFTGARGIPVYGFSANVAPGATTAKTKNQLGLFVTSYKIAKASSSEPITVTADFIGVSESANGQSVETYSPVTLAPFEGRKAKFEIKTGENALTSMTEIAVKNFEITIPTGAELKENSQSDVLTGVHQQTGNEISISWENDETNSATVEDFFKNNTRVSIQVTFSHDAEAYSGQVYEALFQFPSCYLMRDPSDVANENPITEKYTVMVAAPTTGTITDELKITTKDATSGAISV